MRPPPLICFCKYGMLRRRDFIHTVHGATKASQIRGWVGLHRFSYFVFSERHFSNSAVNVGFLLMGSSFNMQQLVKGRVSRFGFTERETKFGTPLSLIGECFPHLQPTVLLRCPDFWTGANKGFVSKKRTVMLDVIPVCTHAPVNIMNGFTV